MSYCRRRDHISDTKFRLKSFRKEIYFFNDWAILSLDNSSSLNYGTYPSQRDRFHCGEKCENVKNLSKVFDAFFEERKNENRNEHENGRWTRAESDKWWKMEQVYFTVNNNHEKYTSLRFSSKYQLRSGAECSRPLHRTKYLLWLVAWVGINGSTT